MARQFAHEHPKILAIAMSAAEGDLSGVDGGCDEQFEFEFALDLRLEGAGKLHRPGRTLARTRKREAG